MQTRPWGSWRDPEAPPSYCLFLPCFTLISLGFTVLTPSSPWNHGAQGALENPPQNTWHFLRHVVVCVARELGWQLSPESIRALTHSPWWQPKTTRNVQRVEDLWSSPKEHPCEDTYPVISSGEFISILLRLLLSGKIRWAQSCELLAKACDSSPSHK